MWKKQTVILKKEKFFGLSGGNRSRLVRDEPREELHEGI
jgi:hypothetical protein